MNQKLLKLIKTLKTFSTDDLSSVIEDQTFDLNLFLNQLESQKIIKNIGINKFAYIGDFEKKSNKNHLKVSTDTNKWLDVNFKGDVGNIKLDDINPLTFFDDKSDRKIYEQANDICKRNIVRCYSIFKLAGTYSGTELSQFLFDISKINPDLKMSYSNYVYRKRLFKANGIISFYKKEHSDKNTTRFPKEVLEEFEKLYFSSNKYSYKHCAAILRSKYGKEFVPTEATLSRYMNSKYSSEELLAVRKNTTKEIVGNFYEINRTAKSLPYKQFYKFALDYMSRRDFSKTKIYHIRKHLIPYFGEYDIDKITPEEAMKFQAYKLQDGISIRSIKSLIATLNDILVYYAEIKQPLVPNTNSLLPMLEINVLNEDEIKDLIKNKSVSLWILILGISLQELIALDYSMIDFDNKKIHINRVFSNRSIRLHRELYQMRVLKLHPLLLDMLDKDKKDGLIYEPLDIQNVNILLNTHVKLMLDKNVPIYIICKNLGLKNVDDFTARYGFLLNYDEPQVDILEGMY